MTFSNSTLAVYKNLSPNCSRPRNHEIDTVTIHCVEGQCTVEALGKTFANPSRKASSNYGIGKDGLVGLYVEECNRAWTSSSASNDHRAITIEVASDTKPPYAVTEEAYNSLIVLLVDICERNGIESLKWKNDKSLVGNVAEQNMTVHQWFADTSCPGEYLLSRMGDIAAKVNEILDAERKADTEDDIPFPEVPYGEENLPDYSGYIPQTENKAVGDDFPQSECNCEGEEKSSQIEENEPQKEGIVKRIIRAIAEFLLALIGENKK